MTTRNELRIDRARIHAERIEREAAIRAAAAAVDFYRDNTTVGGYTRIRRGQAETVTRHYKGVGPKKKVPNLPLPRLKAWLLAHGVKDDSISDAYSFITFTDDDRTTHDLIAAGLLTPGDYVQALNALPVGARF